MIESLLYLLPLIVYGLLIIVPLLLAVAYLTYVERKIIAAMQLRVGPNVVGWFGLLQPFADGLKLLHKETIIPTRSNPLIFLVAPLITFGLSFSAWAVIPFGPGMVISNINVGVLYLFAISSLGVYGIIIAGWASNSKYPFLGALRSAAQMVSYEVSIGLILVAILLSAGSMNLTDIVEAQKSLWYVIPHFPIAVVFIISALAETNRTPFDLPEAESELVSGYSVEYSAIAFALFFLGEYGNMILMSAIGTLLFFGGWHPPFYVLPFTWIPGIVWFSLKMSFLLFIFLWVRGTFPRFRYDQLMRLGWKVFLPFTLAWVVLTGFVIVAFDLFPGGGQG